MSSPEPENTILPEPEDIILIDEPLDVSVSIMSRMEAIYIGEIPEEVQTQIKTDLVYLEGKLGHEIHIIPEFVYYPGSEDITFFTKNTQIAYRRLGGKREAYEIKAGEVVLINTKPETLQKLDKLIGEASYN